MRQIEEILSANKQNHLLSYMDRMDNSFLEIIKRDIESIDFSLFESAVKKQNTHINEDITPARVLKISDRESICDRYYKLGLDNLKNNKIAALLLAGGMGSRLGSSKPKGMLNVGVETDLSLFQIHIENIKKVTILIGRKLYFFIMVSNENHKDTIDFFKANDYFNYDPEYIKFFIQSELPTLDQEDRLLMKDETHILKTPDGNGNFYNAMVSAGYDQILIDEKIEWLNVFSVDNVLQNIFDPVFIGSVIDSSVNCGAKVIKKATPRENVGTICRFGDVMKVIEYYDLSDCLANKVDKDGNYYYGYGVTLNYLLHTEALREIKINDLPLHKVEKKLKCCDADGVIKEITGYKFEYLLTDLVEVLKTCLPFEICREKEFAPIKNLTGVDSLESAREALIKNGYII